jgi:ribosomal protein L20A (L18A)
MAGIMGKLRWFPLGPIEGPLELIKKNDLDNIAKKHGVNISLEEMRGAVQGETRGKAIEQITQWVVTVSADDEEAFRGVIRALVKKYRAPRTTYATLGSDEKARRMIVELFNEEDGWL